MFHSNSYMRQPVPALRPPAIVKTRNAYPKSEEILSFTIYNIISWLLIQITDIFLAYQ